MTDEELDAIERWLNSTTMPPRLPWYKETLPKLLAEVRRLREELLTAKYEAVHR